MKCSRLTFTNTRLAVSALFFSKSTFQQKTLVTTELYKNPLTPTDLSSFRPHFHFIRYTVYKQAPVLGSTSRYTELPECYVYGFCDLTNLQVPHVLNYIFN